MITRTAFLAPRPLRRVEFDSEIGPGLVREMSAEERDRFEADTVAKKGSFRARLVAYTLCDEEGALLLSDKDVPEVAAMPARVLAPIVEAAVEVNGMRPEDVKDLEDAAKNSGSGRNGNSSSASPSPSGARSAS